MRKWLFLVLLVFAVPLNSAAQIIPHFAVFGGYSHVHSKYTASNNGFGLNGWDTSFEVKPLPFISLVGDLSKQYGSPSGIGSSQTNFLVGPQLSVPGIKRVIPFAHAMVGVVHGSSQPIYCPALAGFLCPSIPTGTNFATAVGGGVDYQLKGPIWVRAAQIDWIHSSLNPDHRSQVRFATGIVFRFGK
ncbi:MAG: hypothetical protein ACM3NO_05375 [Deltaproteobacteria bacterium]